MVLAELSQIAIIALRAYAELVCNLGGHVEAEIGEGGTALAGVMVSQLLSFV